MENSYSKIILDINLKQILNPEQEQKPDTQTTGSAKQSRWARIKNKVGCTNTSNLGDLAQKLMNTDLIPERKLRLLKNESPQQDPMLVMDVRHEEARRDHQYNDRRSSSWNIDIVSEAKKIVKQERLQELLRRRQVDVIDNELNSFKKELNKHKNAISRDKTIARPCHDTTPWEDSAYWAELPVPGKTQLMKKFIAPKLISTNNRRRPYKNASIKSVNFVNTIEMNDHDSVLENLCDGNDNKPEVLQEPACKTIEQSSTIVIDNVDETVNGEIIEAHDANNCENNIAIEDIINEKISEKYVDDQTFSSTITHANESMMQESVSKIIQEEILLKDEYSNDSSQYIKGQECKDITVNMRQNKNTDESEGKLTRDIENLSIQSVSLKPIELYISSANKIQNEEPTKNDVKMQCKNTLKKKAFSKWKSYCSRKIEEERIKKIEEEEKQKEPITNRIDSFLKNLQERKKMLNMFSKSTETLKTAGFDLSTKKKKSSSAPLQTKYQHRFIAQQNIIAQQKARLLEQERMIQQMRAKKLAAEARDSVQQACADYLDAVRRNDKIDGAVDNSRRMRPATENVCLKLEVDRLTAKRSEIENVHPNLRLESHAAPAFLQAMDARAQQRQMRHLAAQERRKQREELQRLAKEREEQAKLEEDREAKLFRIAERRRKREEEEERQRCLQQERDRMRRLEQAADLHVRQVLLRRYGLQPLKRLVEIRYCDMLLAKEHYRRNLLKTTLCVWHNKTQSVIEKKLAKADYFNNLRLMRIYYSEWFQFHMEIRSNLFVAEDWYNLKTLERMVQEWSKTAKALIIERDKKCYLAQLHYERQLKWRCIDKWRLLPSFNKIARQRERRKDKWRNKVWEILPDYKPVTED